MIKRIYLALILTLLSFGVLWAYTYEKTTNLSSYASFSAAKTAVGTTKTVLNVDTLATLTQDQNCTSSMAVNLAPGGSINTGTNALTINGPFSVTGPNRQVFYGTGAVTFGKGSTECVRPEWFGSVGDNSTDDYAPLNLARNSVATNGGTVCVNKPHYTSLGPNFLSGTTLKVEQGGSFNLAPTKKLYISGGLDAGRYRILDGAAAMQINSTSTLTRVFPEWFGSSGDNATDDSASINAAVTAMQKGQILDFGDKNYKANITVAKSMGIVGTNGMWQPTVTYYGLRPYDNTLPAIKFAVSGADDRIAVTIKDLAIYGNKFDSLTGIHIGPGVWNASLENVTVHGFVKDNILIGAYTDEEMIAPITHINIDGFYIVPMNMRGNGIHIREGATGVGTNNWITAVRLNRGWLNTYSALNAWQADHTYTAVSDATKLVSATDDHVPDASTDDWGWVFVTSSECTTGGTEPASWKVGDGNTTSDGNCTWTAQQRGRLVLTDHFSASLNISDTWIEPEPWGGIRFQGDVTPITQFSNVIIDTGTDFPFLEDQTTTSHVQFLYGSIENVNTLGTYKPKGFIGYTPGGVAFLNNFNVMSTPHIFMPRISWGAYFTNLYSENWDPNDRFIGLIEAGVDEGFKVSQMPTCGGGKLELNYDCPSNDVRFGGATGGKWNKTHPELGPLHLWHDNSTSPGHLRFKEASSPASAVDGYKLMYLDTTDMYPGDLWIRGRILTYDNNTVENGASVVGSAASINMAPIYHGGNGTIYHYYMPLTEPVAEGPATLGESFFLSYDSAPGAGSLIDGAEGGADAWLKNSVGGSTKFVPMFSTKEITLSGGTTGYLAKWDTDNETLTLGPISDNVVTMSATPTAAYLAKFDASGKVLVDGPSSTAPSFATTSLTGPRPTAGSGTGVTVNDAGSLRTQVCKITVAKDNFVTAGVNHDLTIATLPAKSIVHSVIADVTQAFVCASVCTTGTLSATVGISAGGVEFLESFDLDAAAATFGDADSEVGTMLDIAGATNGGYISWAGTPVILRAVSGTGNWGNGAATNLNAGSVTFYILYSILP